MTYDEYMFRVQNGTRSKLVPHWVDPQAALKIQTKLLGKKIYIVDADC